MLFENVNGNSEKAEEFIRERHKKIGNVSIKFLPELKQWQNGFGLRVGGQPENIDVFIKDLKKSGLFFRQLENIKIFRAAAEEKSWVKIPL